MHWIIKTILIALAVLAPIMILLAFAILNAGGRADETTTKAYHNHKKKQNAKEDKPGDNSP